MSESGFEVAAAYVRVSPDVADFPALLDEALGGLQIAISIIPDSASLANFAGSVDDGLGDLTATVSVGADTAEAESGVEELLSEINSGRGDLTVGADTSGALDQAQALADEMSGMSADLNVGASTGSAAEGIGTLTDELGSVDGAASSARSALSAVDEEVTALQAETDKLAASLGHVAQELGTLGSEHAAGLAGAGLGTLPVTVVPDVSDFAQQLDEELGGTTVPVTVTPDVSDFAAAIDEAVGDGIVIPVTADTSQAVASVEELGSAAETADSGIETLYNGILSIGPAATQAEMEAVDALGTIREAAASIPADAITEPFAAIGPAAQSMAAEVTSSAGEAESGIETFLGGIYSLGPAADAAASQVADAMGNARQAIADEASAAGSVDYSAATAGLEGVAGASGDVAKAAPAAGEAASGLGGVLGMLGQRLSYVAVDPFMWMYGAPMVIQGVTAAIQAFTGATGGLIGELAQQDKATGFNISGYQQLSAQLGIMSKQMTDTNGVIQTAATENARFGMSVSANSEPVQQLTEASGRASAEAQDLIDHLGTLEGMYGLTAPQAEALATAAGVSAKQLAVSGDTAHDAMVKIEAYANANIGAQGPVNELANDVSTFGDDALTASTRVSALDDAYSMLVGKFATSQTDMLTVAQDFLNIQAGAQLAGASMTGTNQQSLALQQSFYATAGAIEQTANAMTQQGDSAAQVTAYIQEQTDKLSGLTGGNQQAQQAVQGLRQWEDNLRGSVDATSQAILTSAGHLQDSFIKQLEDAGAKSSATKTDVDELTTSILATGDKSNSTASARAQLIKDLENAGLSAQKATTYVDGFIKKLDQIPKNVSVTLHESATGQWTITGGAVSASQGAGGSGNAAGGLAGGGLVAGGSGHPRADDIHAMLSHGEYVVQAPAVGKYGTGLLDSINAMHFAGGGYAGDLPGLGGWINTQYMNTQYAMEQTLMAIVERAIAQAEAGAKSSKGGSAPVIVNFNGTQYPTPEQQQALMHQLSAAVGVS
jgi:hypothetical protein